MHYITKTSGCYLMPLLACLPPATSNSYTEKQKTCDYKTRAGYLNLSPETCQVGWAETGQSVYCCLGLSASDKTASVGTCLALRLAEPRVVPFQGRVATEHME